MSTLSANLNIIRAYIAWRESQPDFNGYTARESVLLARVATTANVVVALQRSGSKNPFRIGMAEGRALATARAFLRMHPELPVY